jgi:hypothetical protein
LLEIDGKGTVCLMKRITLRLAIVLLTFMLGVVITGLIATSPFRSTEKIPVSVLSVAELNVKLNHPKGWRKIDVDNKFSFYLPPDMKQVELLGNIDYYGPTEHFGDKNLMINYGYVEKRYNEELWRGKVSCEMLAGKITDEPSYRSSEVEISGRRAREISWHSNSSKLSFITLCFSDIGDGTVLKFGAVSENTQSLDVAKQIFGSIEFP